MHTSASAVCMWSIEPHIYITILSISLSAICGIVGSIDVVTPLTSSAFDKLSLYGFSYPILTSNSRNSLMIT